VIVGAQDGNAAYSFLPFANARTVETSSAGQFEFADVDVGPHRLILHTQPGSAQTTPTLPSKFFIDLSAEPEPREYDFGTVENQAPSGATNHYTVAEDQMLDVPISLGLLVNTSDPDNDTLIVSLVNPPPFGHVELDGSGSFRYQPSQDFSGSDSFSYRLFDGLSWSEPITATVDVMPTNDPPVARDNGVWIRLNTEREISSPGLLGNDFDPDGDPLQIEIVAPPEHGTVEIRADGSYRYVPDSDYAGPDRFTYRLSDGEVTSNVAQVQVYVGIGFSDKLAQSLRVTEVNYNPYSVTAEERAGGFTNRDRFEFLELSNVGDESLELVGTQIAGNIQFQVQEPTLLAPGEHVVVVSDLSAFHVRYGENARVIGQYEGTLHNSGGSIQLLDPFDRDVATFVYDDEGGWPIWADGFGSTLELVGLWGNPSSPANWRFSYDYGGSPGEAGAGYVGDVVVNEVLTHANLPQTDAIELFNTTDEPIDISGWFLTDSANDFKLFQIPPQTVLGAGEYVVFDEYDFNPGRWDPALGGFAFDSALGDDVWLMAADSSGNLTRFVDHVEFGAALNGQPFVRWPNGSGDLSPTETLTLGSSNSAPRVGPIVISEVMYAPTLSGTDANDFEFIEIYNPTTDSLDLRNWRIRGGIDYDFPDSKHPYAIDFGPGETLVIVPFDPLDTLARDLFIAHYGASTDVRLFGPYSGSLDDNGDLVQLIRADGPAWWEPDIIPRVLEDQLTYETDGDWPTTAATDGDSLSRRDALLWGIDPESWHATLPSPGAVNLQAGTLAISEINYSPYNPTASELTQIPTLTADAFEFFELVNISGREIDLTGMKVTGGIALTFPARTMASGERLVVAKDQTAFQLRYGAEIPVVGDYQRSLGNGGDRITLMSAQNTPLLSFSYSDRGSWPPRADGQGSTLELIDAFSDYGDGENWRASQAYGGTPGTSGESLLERVVVNEILINGTTPDDDRVELYNVTRGPIDISGWYLSNVGGDTTRFRVPSGTTIPSFGYVVFTGSQLAAPATGSGIVMDPYGSNQLYLIKADAQGHPVAFADQVEFGASRGGESWGRWPSGAGELYPMQTPTFDPLNADNSGVRTGPIVISEVMYHPRDTGDLIEQGDLEYIEIYNPTDQTVDLAGWELTDGVEFVFDSEARLSPREALVVVSFDVTDTDRLRAFTQHYSTRSWVDILGGYRGSLSNQADRIRLLRTLTVTSDIDGDRVIKVQEDELQYSDESPWPITADGFGYSLQRESLDGWGSAPTSWVAGPVSPGVVVPASTELSISEINYSPYPPTQAELNINPLWTANDFQFLELVNISGAELAMDGLRFSEGIEYAFPAVELGRAERIVLARNPEAFVARYGATDSQLLGPYAGELSDIGERVSIADETGELLVILDYDVTNGWPTRARGFGSTLEILDVGGSATDPDNWKASDAFGGSPGASTVLSASPVAINEVLARETSDVPEAIELFNRSSRTIDISGWHLTNNLDDLTQFTIPAGTTLAPSGFVTFFGEELSTSGLELTDDRGDLWLIEATSATIVRFVDQISYGLTAAGKSAGLYPDGSGKFLPLSTPTFAVGTNSPVQSPGSLVITELNYAPSGIAPVEFIEIWNSSPYPYDLSGVRLTDAVEMTFGNITLEPLQYGIVTNNPEAVEFYYGSDIPMIGTYSRALSNDGERVLMLDSSGEVLVDFEYSDGGEWPWAAAGRGATLELIDPLSTPLPGEARTRYLNDPSHWQFSRIAGGTPGRSSISEIVDVVINEVGLDATTGQIAIELFNPTDDAIDISNWRLVSFDGGSEWSYQLPNQVALEPYSYYVIEDTQLPIDVLNYGSVWLTIPTDATETSPEDATSFHLVDGAALGWSESSQRLARFPNGVGDFAPVATSTWGAENAVPRSGPIVISEIHYHSSEAGGTDELEFVELYNPSSHAVSLDNWRITGGINYYFGYGLSIAPHSTVVVMAYSPATPNNEDRVAAFRAAYGIDESVPLYGGYNGGLSNGGETIRLMRYRWEEPYQGIPESIEDEVTYGDSSPWPFQADGRGASLTRVGLGWGSNANTWVAAVPSPGTTNLPTMQATMIDQHLFYDAISLTSIYDAITSEDLRKVDTRIAPSTTTGRFQLGSISSHEGGITGVVIDIDSFGSLGRFDDYGVTVYSHGSLANSLPWQSGPAPRHVTLLPHAGENGADRLVLVWNPGELQGKWLSIRLAGNEITGLPSGQTFVFGNLPGDASGDGIVDLIDMKLWRAENFRSVDANAYADFNHDGNVDSLDFNILTQHLGQRIVPLQGDFDGNGMLDTSDVNSLVRNISAGNYDAKYDVNRDGSVDRTDLDIWIWDLKHTVPGDANLDFVVDQQDHTLLEANLFSSAKLWTGGDFNGDGVTDGYDESIWLQYRNVNAETTVIGDFNADSYLNGMDADMLVAAIAGGLSFTRYDINFDGTVDSRDLDRWIRDIAHTLPGDANLDGQVNDTDAALWMEQRFQQNTGWTGGDFNADGATDAQDWNIWNAWKYRSPASVRSEIPAPRYQRSPASAAPTLATRVHRQSQDRLRRDALQSIDVYFSKRGVNFD
jgi:hypothetical protein